MAGLQLEICKQEVMDRLRSGLEMRIGTYDGITNLPNSA